MSQSWQVTLKALTLLWTGGVDQTNDRLHETGLIGSLRWWFEVLVRGLGGKACDPTLDGVRCPDKDGRHCVVCELFGCTGWARKFRLMVVDTNGQVIQGPIQADQKFILRFIPLRPIAPEEWCLLNATLCLIANYGAMGGKTVFKPSDEWGIADLGAGELNAQLAVIRSRSGLPLRQNDVILKVDGEEVNTISDLERMLSGKQHGAPISVKVRRANGTEENIQVWAGKRHHQDFGLIEYVSGPADWNCGKTLDDLRAYVQDGRWRRDFDDNDFSWASLQNFWCVKGRYLARQNASTSSFNQVIGRQQAKRQAQQLASNNAQNQWLAGRQQESKKVFSFRHPAENRRTFGFVKPGTVNFRDIRNRLGQVWRGSNRASKFVTGQQILNQLFS